jgi:hypothetical protein
MLQEKASYGQKIKGAVASDLAKGLIGGGGCHRDREQTHRMPNA